jgi:hypothetical protein
MASSSRPGKETRTVYKLTSKTFETDYAAITPQFYTPIFDVKTGSGDQTARDVPNTSSRL